MSNELGTLWDPPLARPSRRSGDRANPAGANFASASPVEPEQGNALSAVTNTRLPMQQRYDALVEAMKREYALRIRKWRRSSSGCAWQVWYADGTSSRLIESPYPRGPMSCAIFLHEVGHHVIRLGAYKPRCLEEYHAWRWSLETMERLSLNVTAAVHKRMHQSLQHAVAKAVRRGLKRVPVELIAYLPPGVSVETP